LKYPKDALFDNFEGRIYLEFIVKKDGSLSNIRVNKGIAGYLSMEKETLRVLEAMPKWKPAELNDELLRSRLLRPIIFKLK